MICLRMEWQTDLLVNCSRLGLSAQAQLQDVNFKTEAAGIIRYDRDLIKALNSVDDL